MELGDRFDPARLFRREVLDDSGRRLGRVTALVHRTNGCDVLVERRSWLRYKVVRVDIDDLMETDTGRYRYVPSQRHWVGPRDGRVA